MQTYISTDIYHDVLDQLEELFATFDPSKPDCLRTRLIMILGEEGGIWPSSCRNGSENESLKRAA
ncbi:hypothetical protein [Rhizobium sp. BK491]|uniref:hypothetical protein n=1 Tax=Rhizobium sp. BK491 TaxID=2587009 RepID=UPI001621218B|nr:hypothetical protein [Rhizobium sp. BK491]MBB3568730.1 hypothetical protein [Rhizobium sp. BK491]